MEFGRKKNQNIRIFIGLTEIAGIVAAYEKGFNDLGCRTFSVLRKRHPYFTDEHYDIVISEILEKLHIDKIPRIFQLIMQESIVFIQFIIAIIKCDIFLFIFGSSFFLINYIDYFILKLLNKQIISIFCGCDIRHWASYTQEFELLSLDLKSESVCWKCDMRGSCLLTEKIKTVRAAEDYSDLIFSQRTMSQLLHKPYMRTNVPLMLNRYRFRIPDRDKPLVIHAPTNKSIKGTYQIMQVIEKLKNENVQFEFRFVENMRHSDLLDVLTEADIVVDFLYIQAVGVLALEAMATGNAVLSGVMTDYELIPGNCPVIYISPNNLYKELKNVIENKEYRNTCAKLGRLYVEEFHDHIQVTSQMLKLIRQNKLLEFDYYPDFAEKHLMLPYDILHNEKKQRWTRFWRTIQSCM